MAASDFFANYDRLWLVKQSGRLIGRVELARSEVERMVESPLLDMARPANPATPRTAEVILPQGITLQDACDFAELALAEPSAASVAEGHRVLAAMRFADFVGPAKLVSSCSKLVSSCFFHGVVRVSYQRTYLRLSSCTSTSTYVH